MPMTPKQARAVREDTTIERPARKISMVDEAPENPQTLHEVSDAEEKAQAEAQAAETVPVVEEAPAADEKSEE